jgi:hypothetical protein
MGFTRVFVLSLVAAAAALAVAGPAQAEVNVNINLGPPPIVVAEPPAVVAIPQTRVYFAPDPHVDVFFYGGYWWSPRGPRWYRAKAYNGPWVVIEPHRVPKAVVYVPGDYRTRYGNERHVPYGQWKKEHEKWDRENRKSHKKWEKEREKEWKEQQRQEKHGKNGKNGKSGKSGKGHGG